jgi:septal ring factor EnvC (AmiA/AmiB activator)
MPGTPVADREGARPARADRGLPRRRAAHEVGLLALLDQADAAAADVAAARQERERLETEIDQVKVDLAVKETTLARLRNNLNEAEAELGRLRRALEELKRIDLQRRP